MKLARKLLPGQPGTKRWVEKYQDKFVCLRYKYDPTKGKKLKTVEIVVEELDWKPNQKRIPKNKIVNLRVEYQETTLQRIVKGAGGRWNKEKQRWQLPYKEVVALGLKERMVK